MVKRSYVIALFFISHLWLGCGSENGPSSFSARESVAGLDSVDLEVGEVQIADEGSSDELVVDSLEEYIIIPSDNGELALAYRSCNEVQQANSSAESGVYTLYYEKAPGRVTTVEAYCDLASSDGAWTLVLNYVHGADTNPPLIVMEDRFPLLGPGDLGDDEQETPYFGHISPVLASQFEVSGLKFSCETENTDNKIYFKTSNAECISYFQTGMGSCRGVDEDYVSLEGHDAFLPLSQTNTASMDMGDLAMTAGTFRSILGFRQWSINDNGEWECDDDPDNDNNATVHRVWFQ